MMMYSDEATLFEGSYLEVESSQTWGLDMPHFNDKVAMATSVMGSAPKESGDMLESFIHTEYDLGLPSPNSDWMSNQMDLSMFDELVNIPLILDPVLITNPSSGLEKNFPLSPSGSYDSGVCSPSTSAHTGSSFSECDSPSSLHNVDSILTGHDNVLPYDINNCNVFEEEMPVVDPVITEELLQELGIELITETGQNILPTLPYQLNTLDSGLTATTDLEEWSATTILVDVSTEESIPVLENASEIGKLLMSNTTVITNPVLSETLVNVPSTSPIIPKPTKKRKVTNVQEKKQRKRDQNKNAATRYRERKRQESEEKQKTFDELYSKNKTLNDKVSQITREIDYLKELMIEVYTIKGLIP